jgi:hypothetical protein
LENKASIQKKCWQTKLRLFVVAGKKHCSKAHSRFLIRMSPCSQGTQQQAEVKQAKMDVRLSPTETTQKTLHSYIRGYKRCIFENPTIGRRPSEEVESPRPEIGHRGNGPLEMTPAAPPEPHILCKWPPKPIQRGGM